jgi:hypothetical protein
LFLWQDKPERATIKYSDGRSFYETTIQWEEEKHRPGSPTALVRTANVLFAKPETIKDLKEIGADIGADIKIYGSTLDFDELDIAYNKIVNELGNVTSQFEGESREK